MFYEIDGTYYNLNCVAKIEVTHPKLASEGWMYNVSIKGQEIYKIFFVMMDGKLVTLPNWFDDLDEAHKEVERIIKGKRK